MDSFLWLVETLQSLKFVFCLIAAALSIPLVFMACGAICQFDEDKGKVRLVASMWLVSIVLGVLIPSAEVLGY